MNYNLGSSIIDEIKNSTIGTLHSQYRTVTKNDYISFLETRADIVQANVWGEQEEHPEGSVQDYNKVYISLVPSVWDTSTITYVPASADTTRLWSCAGPPLIFREAPTDTHYYRVTGAGDRL